MWTFSRGFVFCVGFAIGGVFAVLVFISRLDANLKESFSKDFENSLVASYDVWFETLPFERRHLSPDEARYGSKSVRTESELLRRAFSLTCAIGTSNTSGPYVKAINSTWLSSCDRVLFYDKERSTVTAGNLLVQNHRGDVKSSFHALCDAIRQAAQEETGSDWALFVKEDLFVVPENLRYLLAPLNSSHPYYLGHTINFWGVDFNAASSGFVLSRGTMLKFTKKFPDSKACISGGKYWKQEDMYLGKHLRNLGIFPMDTRDEKKNTLFLGYDLDKVMFPNSVQQLSNFYVRALYPVKCCGRRTITFQVLSSTEIYRYYYMIYTLRIFSGGSLGNRPAPTQTPVEEVWKGFLRERGLPGNITSHDYEKAWYLLFENTTTFPEMKKKPSHETGITNIQTEKTI